PFPSRNEQDRIVAKLDSLFEQLESINKSLDHMPTLLKNFRQQVLTQAVTGKLTEEWRKGKELDSQTKSYLKKISADIQEAYEIKCSEAKKIGNRKPKDQRKNKKSDKDDNNLPKIPSVWKYTRAEELSYLITDGVHFRPKYTENGIPFLSVKNVRPFSISEKDCKYISDNDHNEYIKRCNPEFGDILYTKVGATFGYAALVKNVLPFSIYVSLALIKPSKLLLGKYIELLFNSQLIFNQARHRVSGSGVPDLHLIEIRDFKIPVTIVEEQQEIVNRVEVLLAKADAIEVHYQALKTKIEHLPQAILHKAFKGELVPQLESDGDARELLKEIEGLKNNIVSNAKNASKRK
ncbi:restriction endonuclease subunit S, partial [Christiangramia marina]|uniref:restriction endonuclease subunit S n=1 Tax=Christiangramia marina TaxID=409436 RepID=UPI003AA81ECE